MAITGDTLKLPLPGVANNGERLLVGRQLMQISLDSVPLHFATAAFLAVARSHSALAEALRLGIIGWVL